MSRIKRKRKLDEDEEHPAAHGNEGGGRGIYRKNAHKRDCDFDYGSEYRAKVGPPVQETGAPNVSMPCHFHAESQGGCEEERQARSICLRTSVETETEQKERGQTEGPVLWDTTKGQERISSWP